MYKLIDGERIIEDNKTMVVLNEQTVKIIQEIVTMVIDITATPLTEQHTDILLDCIINDHFSVGGSIKDLEENLYAISMIIKACIRNLPKRETIPF